MWQIIFDKIQFTWASHLVVKLFFLAFWAGWYSRWCCQSNMVHTKVTKMRSWWHHGQNWINTWFNHISRWNFRRHWPLRPVWNKNTCWALWHTARDTWTIWCVRSRCFPPKYWSVCLKITAAHHYCYEITHWPRGTGHHTHNCHLATERFFSQAVKDRISA